MRNLRAGRYQVSFMFITETRFSVKAVSICDLQYFNHEKLNIFIKKNSQKNCLLKYELSDKNFI